MSWLDQIAEALYWHHIKPWVTGAVLALVGLTFLGKPSSPSIIVSDRDGRLGIVEANQFKTSLDEPLPGYVAWSCAKPEAGRPTSDDFRRVLRADRADDRDPSPVAQQGLNGIDGRSTVTKERDVPPVPKRSSTVDEAREASIWKNETRDKLVVPIPLPSPITAHLPVPFPVAPLTALPVTLPITRLHVARIPPRVAKPKSVGHVKPDSDREGVWLRSMPLDLILLNAEADDKAGTTKTSRAQELDSDEYLVGWLFIITTCRGDGKCELGKHAEANCLKPETLTDHVLGMTHLVIPRTYLYNSKKRDANQPAQSLVSGILKGGGLTLLTGADYDYVSLRVSHYPPGGHPPSDIDEQSSSSAAKPSRTRESSIAMLDERLHEILAMINRASDLEDGDLVLILPTELDIDLRGGGYLIVGLDDIPPPLRSHYRADSADAKDLQKVAGLEIAAPQRGDQQDASGPQARRAH